MDVVGTMSFVMDVIRQAVAAAATMPANNAACISIAGLMLSVWKSQLPLVRASDMGINLTASNPYLMAFTAFLVQLAVVAGIVLSLGVLSRSGSTRRGKSAPMVRLIRDCGGTWINICCACCFSYLLLGMDAVPAVMVGERPVHVIRIAEWIYTVPLVWYVYARVYTAANDQQLKEVVTANTVMLTVGHSGIFCFRHTLLYVPVFATSMLLFFHQGWLIWMLPPANSDEVNSIARKLYIVAQSLMLVYPVVWICGDLALIPSHIEQGVVFTLLDVLCKLILVWGCIVFRFIQAFPVLHTCFEGSQQFLDASHDVRLTLDANFCIRDVDGKAALLRHYLGEDRLLRRSFMDMCYNESERRKLVRAAQLLDRQVSDTLSPKLTLALIRVGTGSVVGTDCVLSAAQNRGLRLIGITFHELALEEAAERQTSGVSSVSNNCNEGTRQNTPSVLEMESASCVGMGHMGTPTGVFRRQFASFAPLVAQQRPRQMSAPVRTVTRQLSPPIHTSSASFPSLNYRGSKDLKDACDGKSHLSMMSSMSRRSKMTTLSAVSLREHVEWVHQTVGQLLESETEPAFLADVMSESYPIVGCSKGFLELTQYPQDRVLGTSLFFLEQGVPDEMISKSTKKNLASFCEACRFSAGTGGRIMGDIQVTQPGKRAGGSVFVNCCLCSLVMLRNRPYILGVPSDMGEGCFLKQSRNAMEARKEESREKVRRIRENLQAKIGPGQALPDVEEEEGSSSFFSDLLQDHCILMNWGRTAMRREPYDLPAGCLVFSRQPVQIGPDGSLRFEVLVDDVMPKFDGLPLLGFTQHVPRDSPDCYPNQANCLAQSVTIGRNGEAFARDHDTHAVMGFRAPPPSEMEAWCLDEGKPAHLRRAPFRPEPGDALECVWGADGTLSMLRNGNVMMSFDVKRHPEHGKRYYAAVDVAFGVSQLTLLPFQVDSSRLPATFSESPLADEGPLERKIRRSVLDLLARKAITKTVANCRFCVTVADPSQSDCPLVAVSEEFLRITGYDRAQVLGRNCRFLNEGCPADPQEIMALRNASRTGERATVLLTNRRRTGELFVNLLDLAGVTVAKDLDSGSDIWYLIGVQADVTDLAEGEQPEDHLPELELVADGMRTALARELRQICLDESGSLLPPSSTSACPDSCSDSASTISASTRGVSKGMSEVSKKSEGTKRRIQILDELQWCGEKPPQPLLKSALEVRDSLRTDDTDASSKDHKPVRSEGGGSLRLAMSVVAASAAAAALLRVSSRR